MHAFPANIHQLIDIMCINDGIELLLIWFEKNDSFNGREDYMSLDWALLDEKKNIEHERKACIFGALRELEKENYAKHCGDSKPTLNDTWVTMTSQKTAPRQCQISPQTCENVSSVVNGFLPMLDINVPQKSDPKNIGEADVIILLSVINSFAKRLEEIENESDNGNRGRSKKK